MANAIKLDSAITTHTIKETYSRTSCCLRCGGFLVAEQCVDFYETQHHSLFWATRCIQCGDLVDEVTLRNRAKRLPTQVIDTDPVEIIKSALERAA
ncbi:MAG: hypothetical protein QM706_17680 [Nitrospira sp.]